MSPPAIFVKRPTGPEKATVKPALEIRLLAQFSVYKSAAMWPSIARLLGLSNTGQALPAKGPDGEVLYAVGDIHGRADLLLKIIDKIETDFASVQYSHRPIIVFLGDYIDRGPSSHDVVHEILRLKTGERFSVCTLRGNHDQFLLDFLEDGRGGAHWISYGGDATLRSYGVDAPSVDMNDAEWLGLAGRLKGKMPFEHRMFFQRTRLALEFGDYVLAHAGVRPGVPVAQQSSDDLMCIREEFLNHPNPAPGRTVIFGHTPFLKPLVQPGKIGIDTGAYASGTLTSVRIIEDSVKFIQTN
jgi:serine/threonine protein phosphatase 1